MKTVAITAAWLAVVSCSADKETASAPTEKDTKNKSGSEEPATAPVTKAEEKPSTEAKPNASRETEAQPDNDAVEVRCAKLVLASELKNICGVDKPLAPTPQEVNKTARTVICQRVTAEGKATKLLLSVLDYGEEQAAKQIAGNPADGEATAKSKPYPRIGGTETKATMYRGRYVISISARTVKGETPLCTPEQLDKLVKQAHARFPGK